MGSSEELCVYFAWSGHAFCADSGCSDEARWNAREIDWQKHGWNPSYLYGKRWLQVIYCLTSNCLKWRTYYKGDQFEKCDWLKITIFTKIGMIFSCPNLLTYFSGIAHRKSISQFEWTFNLIAKIRKTLK